MSSDLMLFVYPPDLEQAFCFRFAFRVIRTSFIFGCFIIYQKTETPPHVLFILIFYPPSLLRSLVLFICPPLLIGLILFLSTIVCKYQIQFSNQQRWKKKMYCDRFFVGIFHDMIFDISSIAEFQVQITNQEFTFFKI